MTVLDKIKAFFKRPKPEAKAAGKKAAEPLKVAEAPEKKVDESNPSRKRALSGETRVLGVFAMITTSLIRARTPPVTGALWESGLAAGPARE